MFLNTKLCLGVKKRIFVYILLLVNSFVYGQQVQDSDSILKTIDTQRIALDTQRKAEPISQPIDYTAQDSIYFDFDSMVTYLYSNVEMSSEKMSLKAGKVKVDMSKNEVEAYYIRDSLGRIAERPVFSDGENEFLAYYLKYNFKTKKGFARHVKTEQDEGYLHGEVVKIFPGGVTNIKQGKFTTCDLDHPHYYIDFTKAKYIPDKSIVTGFSYFVIEDIPIPIFLPFGYYPQRKFNTSGIVQPSFMQEQLRGYGLVGLGYYFAINDYMDLKITGDVFSKGSWGFKISSNYKMRYRFSGNFSFQFSHISNGEPYLPGAINKNTFAINWQYTQAQKANPTSNFSISVHLDKGRNGQFNATNIQEFTRNVTTSSISYQKRFRGTPFRLGVTGNLTQNLARETISGSLPIISFNMNSITPFRNLGHNPRAWYKDLSFSMTSNFRNSFETNDSLFFANPLQVVPLMKNGFVYKLPVSKSFKVFRYFNLTTNFNYTGRVYFNQIYKHIEFVDSQYQVVVDTIFQPKHFVDYNYNLGLSTTLYGMFNINKFGVKAVRHVFTPSINYRLKPDYGDPKWGYYLPEPGDTTGRLYAIVPDRVVGYPAIGQQKSLGFNFNNRFEAKVKSKKDTVETYKKITLLDNLSISGSYNFAADSMNLSNILVRASTRIYGSNVSFSSTFDPYAIAPDGTRINKFEFEQTGKLLRLVNMSLTTGFNINNKTLQKGRGKGQGQGKGKKQGYIPYNYFDPDWNIRVNYRFSLSRGFDPGTQTYVIAMKQIVNTSFDITPTPYWKFSVATGYDFGYMRMTNTTFRVYRDLHCWEMYLQVTPFGRMKGYLFSLRIKSPMFSFFEFKRQRSWHDNSYY